MVEDEEIKTTVSPFAIREGEIKTFDGKDGYVSINQIIHKINLGHISDIHFEILDIVNDYEFVTSRQIYQILTHKGIEIKSQDKLNNKLDQLVKSKILTRYYFTSEEGKGIYRVYCMEKMGKYLLTSKEVECRWQPTDNTKPVHLIKKRLAGNQVIIAYMMKAKYFKNYVVDPVLMAKRQNIRFKVSGGVVTLNNGGRNTDLLFEAVRREVGWEEKLVTKMQLYSEFYEYYNMRDSGFDAPPQLVILGEDDTHLVEIFKLIVKNKIVFKDCNPLYTTDLRQLENEIDKTLIAFRQDQETGRYKMEMQQVPLLAKE